mmetsp:Transcript_11983/g.11861  ORF Transcript_11983/g.11861 Transcript_11983/m.11861 type:complete len:278 (-) Transcript_11983:38-871(-)
MMDFNMSSKLHNLKAARQLAGEITESGAKLFDLLGQEKDLKEARDKALDFLDSVSRNLDSDNEQIYIEKCIRNIIDQQTRKMNEMEDTVKQLKQDENELENKITRRKQELERAEKRLKGIENVKPEYQDEYERLESELERYYSIYVEKFANIDYLEYEIDNYNLKESLRNEEQKKVINVIKGQQAAKDHKEIFNDDEDFASGKKGEEMFNEMRETRTGFGAKMNNKKEFNPGQHNAEGGLQPDDDDSDDVEEDGEEDDGEEGVDVDEDEEDGSDHNF